MSLRGLKKNPQSSGFSEHLFFSQRPYHDNLALLRRYVSEVPSKPIEPSITHDAQAKADKMMAEETLLQSYLTLYRPTDPLHTSEGKAAISYFLNLVELYVFRLSSENGTRNTDRYNQKLCKILTIIAATPLEDLEATLKAYCNDTQDTLNLWETCENISLGVALLGCIVAIISIALLFITAYFPLIGLALVFIGFGLGLGMGIGGTFGTLFCSDNNKLPKAELDLALTLSSLMPVNEVVLPIPIVANRQPQQQPHSLQPSSSSLPQSLHTKSLEPESIQMASLAGR